MWYADLISDPDARWIHSDHTPGGVMGTGLPAGNVQYAHRFDLPLDMPMNAKVEVDLEIAADDFVGSISFGSDSSDTFPTVSYLGGGFSFSSFAWYPGTPASLGLVPGSNYFFVKQCDTGPNDFSGLLYTLTITIEYCVVELDLRSGVIEGAAGPVLLPVGSDDLNVMQVPLPGGNYSTLAGGGGSAAKRISPNSAWLANLSDTAGWINPNHQTGTVNGSGRAPTSALYRHDFQLPAIPSNATVLLDLQWASDETLYGVSLNGDVNIPGGNLAIGGGLGPEFSFASNGQFVSQNAGSLGLMQGTNSLYLSQLENFPGTSYADNPFVCSGIIYIAKLRITFPCDVVDPPDTPFESFCDCTIVSDSPCGNVGGVDQGCHNSTGSGSTITSSGLAVSQSSQSSSLVNTLTLHANNLPLPQTIGIFIEGSNTLSPSPLGDGLRCVGQIRRLSVVITGTGEVSYPPQGIEIPVSPGTKYYQFWYRDVPLLSSPCQKGFNLTNAIGLYWL
jgi:hypothetical protein